MINKLIADCNELMDQASSTAELYTNRAIEFVTDNFGKQFINTPEGIKLISTMVKAASTDFLTSCIEKHTQNLIDSIQEFTNTIDRIPDSIYYLSDSKK